MKPSSFTDHPFSSVLQNSESETIAVNIMVILKRTGNEFRPITAEEYKKERLKDGDFTPGELDLFHKVVKYCKSADTARCFSGVWENATSKKVTT